jgi:hypothetical protein
LSFGNFITALLLLESIGTMTTPVPAAIAATREIARREDYALALPVKIFAFHERRLVRFSTHPL